MRIRMIGLVVVSLLIGGVGVAAARTQEHAPALVAMVASSLPNNAPALVVRYADARQPDLVIIGTGGDRALALAGGLAALDQARQRTPVPSETSVVTVTSLHRSRPFTAARQQMVTRILASIEHGESRQIGGLGVGRVVLAASLRLPR